MIYKLHTGHYDNFHIFEDKKEKTRSYFIPHRSVDELLHTDYKTERYKSKSIIMLSGEWDFRYYGKVSLLPESFDSEKESFHKITVPSTWQRTGFENPWYINSRYQFKLDPPNIPKDIPVGIYRKEIEIENKADTYLINFLGVAACFDLFVNGKYAGYSEGSHNTAEFSISSYLEEGKNEILVAVYKWCNGTYLECQDMFRENGIFRDVYIIEENNIYIRDFRFETQYNKDGKYSLTTKFHVNNAKESTAVYFNIHKNGEVLLADTLTYEAFKNKYDGLEVDEWTAETPNLYEVTAVLSDEGRELSAFRTYIGFRHIEIKGNVFYFNNKNIKLKGINHHETDPKTGYTVTLDDLERDVKLIKKYNCNTVRLSHYPHDPAFLTMCDIYGLYAIDEMDLEAHGVYSNPLYSRRRLISDNLKWESHFIDRAKRMFYRDRVHPSVTMWSLGNEAGGDACQDKCYEFFKSKTDIPVHYENAVHGDRFAYDVIGYFYPPYKLLASIADGSIKDKRFLEKPYFMSEYAHSMGVGPGGLEDYMQFVLNNDNFLGGCIWEFCDHAVYDEKAKYRYTYGGDHGEKKHDKNFCVDGMFFPDRTPSTGALTMRECYRPVRAEKISDGEYLIKNTNSFIDTSCYDISWSLLKDGEPVKNGTMEIAVRAGESAKIKLENLSLEGNYDYTLDIVYKKGDDYVAREQFSLKKAEKQEEAEYRKPEVKVKSGKANISFSGGGSMIFGLRSGEILSYKPNGKELINENPVMKRRGFMPNIYRAPIDNEMFIKIAWNILGLLKAKPAHLITRLINKDKLTFESRYRIGGYGTLAFVTVRMTVADDGTLDIQADIKRGLKLLAYSEITRFGLTLEMPEEFNNIKWYGLGERETFSDFSSHGFLGKYSLKAENMHEKYIKPQESGNRSEVRYFTVTDNDGNGIRVDCKEKYLNFNANNFTRLQLEKAKHIEDVTPCRTVNVQIDGFMRGIGSNSCGPLPQKEHIIDLKKPLSFGFTVKPL